MPQPKNSLLRQACQVIMVINETGESTWAEIRKATGLNETQVSTALATLKREAKVYVKARRHPRAGGNVYAFNDDYTPDQGKPDDTWHRRTDATRANNSNRKIARRKVRTATEMLDEEIVAMPEYIRFRDRKIAVLAKLVKSKHVSAEDRDLLLGIMSDYHRGVCQAHAVNHEKGPTHEERTS